MTNLISKSLTKLAAPVADRFVGNTDAAIEHHLLNISVAEGEGVIQPDAVADDLGRKAVTVVQF